MFIIRIMIPKGRRNTAFLCRGQGKNSAQWVFAGSCLATTIAGIRSCVAMPMHP